jgi:hypothetical protein
VIRSEGPVVRDDKTAYQDGSRPDPGAKGFARAIPTLLGASPGPFGNCALGWPEDPIQIRTTLINGVHGHHADGAVATRCRLFDVFQQPRDHSTRNRYEHFTGGGRVLRPYRHHVKRLTLDLDQHELPRSTQRHRPRSEGDTQPRRHEPEHCLDAIRALHDPRLKFVPATGRQEDRSLIPRTSRPGRHDLALVGKLPKRNRAPAGDPMVRPHRRVTRTTRRDHLNRDSLAIEFDIAIEVEETHIHLAVTQIPQLLLNACLTRKHGHHRAFIVEGSDDRRNDARRERAEMRNTERPQIPGSDASSLPDSGPDRGQRWTHTRKQRLPRRCQLHSLWWTRKQPHPNLLLEPRDLLAECWLRNMEPLSSPREMKLLRQDNKRFQQADIQRNPLILVHHTPDYPQPAEDDDPSQRHASESPDRPIAPASV